MAEHYQRQCALSKNRNRVLMCTTQSEDFEESVRDVQFIECQCAMHLRSIRLSRTQIDLYGMI